MASTSVQVLKKEIKSILKGADLDSLSAKKVRKMLETKFDADFSERKKEIDNLVMKLIEDLDEENNKSEEDNGKSASEEPDEEEVEPVPKKKAKKSPAPSKASSEKKRKSASKADDSEDPVMSSVKEMNDEDLAKKLQEEEESGLRRRSSRAAAPKPKQRKERVKDPEKKKTSNYSRPCALSEQLGDVLGATEMPRAEVVKTLWSIVKERNLQDPKNGQYMLCDAQMEKLFGLKRVRLFSMMKYLAKHIKDVPR